MKKHSKHTKLTRRNNGDFGPNELAFLGVKCGVITNLVEVVSKRLHTEAKIAYADASHGKDNTAPLFDTYTYHSSGDMAIASDVKRNVFNERIRFAEYDLVLVNGNHFPAQKQVIFLDPEKESSIEKRMDQITDIQFFIKTNETVEIFKSLREKFPNCTDIPVFDATDIDAIVAHLKSYIYDQQAELNGLVLIGGKSTRMGEDKSQLSYYGMPQSDYTVQLLEKQQLDTFVSVRAEQDAKQHKTITDAFVGLGPFGAICSAFMKNPNNAYLVLATDLPYVSEALVAQLIAARNPKKIATAIKGKSAKFMEPLVTIWEPKAYPILLSYLAQGYSCPRKILINSDVEIVEVDDTLIRNVNTPEEYKQVQDELNS